MDEKILKSFEGKEVALSHYDETGNTRNKLGKVLQVANGRLTLQYIDDSGAIKDIETEKIFYIALRRKDGS